MCPLIQRLPTNQPRKKNKQYRESGVRVNGVLPACIHTGALDRMAHKKGKDVGEYAHSRAVAHPMGKVLFYMMWCGLGFGRV